MRKLIDAHVHITPASQLNRVDPRFKVKKEAYGKFLFANGNSFQFMPCYMQNSQFTDDTLIHMMDFYGVERAVILQSMSLQINAEVAAAVLKYPDRLVGAMVVEPKEDCLDTLEFWHSKGLKVMKFEMSDGLGFATDCAYPGMKFDEPRMKELFDLAEKHNMTVTIDTGPIGGRGYQLEEIGRSAAHHPKLRFVICHLGFPRPLDTEAHRARWRQMIELAKAENVWLDVAAMPDFFEEEGYPFKTATELMQRAKEVCGAEKLIWGTDITGTLNRATYPQMIRMYEECEFLSETEKDMLFYSNARDAYF